MLNDEFVAMTFTYYFVKLKAGCCCGCRHTIKSHHTCGN